LNVLLAAVAGLFIFGNRNRKIFNVLFVLFTGIAGIMALLLLPKNE
jgi:hypothetical protein